MKALPQRPLLTCAVVALIMIVAIGALLVVIQQQTRARRLAAAQEIATVLGYRPEDEVATGFPCTEIIPECWIYLVFKTDRTREEITSAIESSTLKVKGPRIADLESTMSYTDRTLEIVGVRPEYVEDVNNYPYIGWSIDDEGYKNANVSYFDVPLMGEIYSIDGEILNDKLIIIQIRFT